MPLPVSPSDVTRYVRLQASTVQGPGTNTAFIPKVGSLQSAMRASAVSLSVSPRNTRLGRVITQPAASAPVANPTVTFSTLGGNDGIIVKYTADGDIQWTARIGGTNSETPVTVVTDDSFNVYAIGQYGSNPLTIFNQDAIPFKTLANVGVNDIFLVKYNSSGLVQWATRVGGTSSDSPSDLFIDNSLNVYLVGSYQNSPLSIFNENETTFGTLQSFGGTGDIFLVKYNSSGLAQWATRLGGTGSESTRGIVMDNSSNVYISITFASPTFTICNQDGTTFRSLTRGGTTNTDALVVKYNTDGFAQWVAHTTGIGSENPLTITIDESSNVYQSGEFGGTITLLNQNGSTFGTLTGSGFTDMFVIKYNSEGSVQWATRLGGTNDESGMIVRTDALSNVYVVGRYASGTVTIFNQDGTTFGTLSNSPAGISDIFLIKYNSAGAVQWATRIGGTSNDSPVSMVIDNLFNTYILGQYASNPLTVFNQDGTPFKTLTKAGTTTTDIYLVKYSPAGTAEWATQLGGTGNDTAVGMVIDSAGDVVICGNYANSFSVFNQNDSLFKTLSFIGSTDGYIIKYDTLGNGKWASTLTGTSGESLRAISVDKSKNIYMTAVFASANTLLTSRV